MRPFVRTASLQNVLVVWFLLMSGTACESTSGKAAAEKAITDASLSSTVQSTLTNDRRGNFARVDVEAERGVVTLKGAVPSSEQKVRAEQLARSVKGVGQVHNHLQVQRAPTTAGKAE